MNVRRSRKRVITKKFEKYTGHFPLSPEFRFEFLDISSGEWNHIFVIISGKQGFFPLNQIFRSFRNKVQEWYRNLHGKFPEIRDFWVSLEPFNWNFRKFRKESEIEWELLVKSEYTFPASPLFCFQSLLLVFILWLVLAGDITRALIGSLSLNCRSLKSKAKALKVINKPLIFLSENCSGSEWVTRRNTLRVNVITRTS